MLGVLLINKPAGITSHDAVYRVRKALGTRKVGHAGTLDPLATGLLVVAVGAATRFLRYMALEPKEYFFTAQFGVETDSYDRDGETVATNDVPHDLVQRVQSALPAFVGEVEQLPPLFSAVKKDGVPLYKYARKGEDVEREPRTVHIESLTLEPAGATTWPHSSSETAVTEFSAAGREQRLTFRCVCSSGTYVRTIAHDLGRTVGCGAHVVSLVRARAGRFRLEDAVELEAVQQGDLIPLADALGPMPLLTLKDGPVQVLRNGNPLIVGQAPGTDRVAVQDEDGEFVCVARVAANALQPECVVPREEAIGQVR